jgi:hypothetical protein
MPGSGVTAMISRYLVQLISNCGEDLSSDRIVDESEG